MNRLQYALENLSSDNYTILKDQNNSQKKNICIFCGASDVVDQKYIDFAMNFGQVIAKAGFNMVYGGSKRGLMGACAAAAARHGARIIGVYPTILTNYELISTDIDEIVLVNNLADRKRVMMDIADVYVILPGGFGTLDEFFEVTTIKKIMNAIDGSPVCDKPIIIVNFDSFWDTLFVLLDEIARKGFANTNNRKIYHVVNGHLDCIKLLEQIFNE